jgi:hypothetical protein
MKEGICILLTYKGSDGVEIAIRGFPSEFANDIIVEGLHVCKGVAPPSAGESAFGGVGLLTKTPKDAKTDQSCICDTFSS